VVCKRFNPESPGGFVGIRTTSSARDPGHYCGWLRPDWRSHPRVCDRGSCTAVWLAGSLSNRRHRAIAVAALLGLPDSIKYMALHESQRHRVEALIAAIRPDFKMPGNARFVIEDEKQSSGFNPIYLFREGFEH
jgi:hypothetical protein